MKKGNEAQGAIRILRELGDSKTQTKTEIGFEQTVTQDTVCLTGKSCARPKLTYDASSSKPYNIIIVWNGSGDRKFRKLNEIEEFARELLELVRIGRDFKELTK